jgi:hypothetical protein
MDVNYLVIVYLSRLLIPVDGCELSRLLNIFLLGLVLLELYKYHRNIELTLTARQYGEVVLPDAASGQGPGTLAANLSRCKEGMARVFAVMVKI